ncbi:MAG: hypothetical protein ACRDSS_01740 [Actinocrinis sp.]
MTITGTRPTFAGLALLTAVSLGAAAPALQHGGAAARADQQASAAYTAQPADGTQGTSGSGSPCPAPSTGSGSGTGTGTSTNSCPGLNNTNWG